MVISPSAYSVGGGSVGHTYQAVTGIFATSLVHLDTGQVMSPHWSGPVSHQMLSLIMTRSSVPSDVFLNHLLNWSLGQFFPLRLPQTSPATEPLDKHWSCWWWSSLMRDQPSLTPSLPQPVIFLGRIVQTHTYKVYIFQSYDKSTVNTVHFYSGPFTCSCRKMKQKRLQHFKFHIWLVVLNGWNGGGNERVKVKHDSEIPLLSNVNIALNKDRPSFNSISAFFLGWSYKRKYTTYLN